MTAAAAAAAAAADTAKAAQRLAGERRTVAYLDRQISQKQRRALTAKLQDFEVGAAAVDWTRKVSRC